MELNELTNKLSNLVPMTDFKLDNRASLQLLKYIEAYTKIIPFNSGDKYWNDFFFMSGNTPEKLAKLYQKEIEPNGELLPQQAFLLAVLRLLETPISLLNVLPAAHRELYYRELLGLSSHAAQPDQVALSMELNSTVMEQLLPEGTLFEAGQDEQGNALQYALDASLLANRGYISDLRWLRNDGEKQWVTSAPWDLQAQVSLPSDGIRLFGKTNSDQQVFGGVLITSSLLAMEAGIRKIIVTFEQEMNTQELVAQVSSGNQWLTLTSEVNKKEVTLTLSDKEPAISAPEDLDNLFFTQPVLRLQGKDSQALPEVTGISVSEKDDTKDTSFEMYHLTPFGYSSDIEPLEENPALYLGFTDVKPGQTLALYWKLKSPQQPTVSWYYLDQHNQWAELDSWVSDGTQNLYQDGTWHVELPVDASNQAEQMPVGRYWLRAVVEVPAHEGALGKAPWLYGLIYNAMTATLVNVDSISDSHFLTPLPASSIQRPVEPIIVLASVNQPWASWGGRIPESYSAFFERIAQNLSHRNRSLTWGNMVTLLKERYVSIFDVKYPGNDELTRVPALEQQQLTVIPANRYNDSDDSLRPVLNPARLQEMADWLQQKDSPWASIEVRNPEYLDVKIHYEVIFKPDVNEDFGYRQLQQQLCEVYMPWSIDEQRPVVLNNSINYFQLLATIQQQPLVERVTRLTLHRADSSDESDGTASVEAKDNEVLILVWEEDDNLQYRGNDYE
ncbi:MULTISPECIES: hypothetical protein [Photorhabdus]|uniref:Baseplate protein J-like domain-containing protein n=2 Tax=Photorhabdus asymbiotica TaxID=291112 RepID=B6VNN4_PHOAA|nr:hypothetical protein [Photorhabdus asymbiotica]6J0N_J Chain J, Pvc11 [Photorhabdus asymbiotica subsp. asymbiotica ATCC 43949]6J0N_K Chain K, Pvc11 [Photorhabdus asymbiotica subsp. asymbiotica ATCC 43949]6J0N_L Chain L, Pvc11 [Photorhabdus asymbiotica subsp. asymbiotica ATCC 43949]6J0N_M Chain M, Pvc11 [Photorhabdus asymbiotica subsp. asymbiotica ATCC 43949]6J0N_N Chain N, Pvc11 [Photorhabdus asymbiotica subsp. asymbiotica ATCC 43949]6J0N_O Chain O, Pvc11 [Photorhabdus asymbiotica subsp. as